MPSKRWMLAGVGVLLAGMTAIWWAHYHGQPTHSMLDAHVTTQGELQAASAVHEVQTDGLLSATTPAASAVAWVLPDDGSIYFDYDSDQIKPIYEKYIQQEADRLTHDAKLHIRVEGNTDERGSSEYNLALGQRRAEIVVHALRLLGVNQTQVEAVSWGKEQPKAIGHDAYSWALNRRVDFTSSEGKKMGDQ